MTPTTVYMVMYLEKQNMLRK